MARLQWSLPGPALRPDKRLAAAAVAALVVLAGCFEEDREDPPFDFFVLSLSWSPSYCEAEGRSADPTQCAAGLGHRFVVHGLWPQFERGYPEFCAPAHRERVPDALADTMMDIMPSPGLIMHQWRKHGSCSGLDQEAYFETTRRALDRVTIPGFAEVRRRVAPAQVAERFIDANPTLPSDGIAVTCDDRHLREVRICLTRALDFRSCPEVAVRACRRSAVAMPLAR